MLSQSVDLKLLDLDNSNDPDFFFSNQQASREQKISEVKFSNCESLYNLYKTAVEKKKNNQKTTEKYLRF